MAGRIALARGRPARGRHSLRNCLSDLRSALGSQAGRLRSPTSHTLALDLNGVSVDVLAFDAAVAKGDPASLAAAVALYRGPLLEGWAAEWVFQERQAREQAYLAALEQLAGMCRARGAGSAEGRVPAGGGCWGPDPGAEAERHLRTAVGIDPLRETVQRALMELLAARGEYAGALLCNRELRLRLHRELNAEPDPETRALFERIRSEARERSTVRSPVCASAGPSPARVPPEPRTGRSVDVSLVSPVSLSGSRDQRLSPGPAPILRPDQNGSHPLEEAALPAASPKHLPLQLTSFIGRDNEIAEVQEQLAGHRLVTLTGAGGCGKTRLALETAARLPVPFPDGVWFVELAPLADPAVLPQSVATILGVNEQPDRLPIHTLVEALRPRQLLLVLDNCEHLVAACAQLAETLLQACPQLRILATSREPLGVAGERAYQVPPLSLPRSVESSEWRVESSDQDSAPTVPGLSTLNSQL